MLYDNTISTKSIVFGQICIWVAFPCFENAKGPPLHTTFLWAVTKLMSKQNILFLECPGEIRLFPILWTETDKGCMFSFEVYLLFLVWPGGVTVFHLEKNICRARKGQQVAADRAQRRSEVTVILTGWVKTKSCRSCSWSPALAQSGCKVVWIWMDRLIPGLHTYWSPDTDKCVTYTGPVVAICSLWTSPPQRPLRL